MVTVENRETIFGYTAMHGHIKTGMSANTFLNILLGEDPMRSSGSNMKLVRVTARAFVGGTSSMGCMSDAS